MIKANVRAEASESSLVCADDFGLQAINSTGIIARTGWLGKSRTSPQFPLLWW
jgi:hypothetical protein